MAEHTIEKRVGDTIAFSVTLHDGEDLDMCIAVYDSTKHFVFSQKLSDMPEKDGKKLCVIPHEVTRTWKPSRYKIDAGVFNEDKTLFKSASNTLDLHITESEIGRRL